MSALATHVSDGALGDAARDATTPDDGRRLRRQRNRDAVVEAVLAWYDEDVLDPSAEMIARRAGLSARSVFRYFDDGDDLTRATIARATERVQPLAALTIPPDATHHRAATAIAGARVALFEAMGSAARVARLRAPFNPLLAEQVERTDRMLADQLQAALTGRLAARSDADDRMAAITAVCSFDAYRVLRHAQRLSPDRIAGVLATAILALLT